ncbi:MAG: hypothetical protein ABIQ31_18580 [Ferruginibacter sp.]
MDLPKFVTYKELMLVYGFPSKQAQNKLSTIRAVLGKKRFNNILIVEFCQAENIEPALFEKELQKEIEKLYKIKEVTYSDKSN